MNANDSTTRTFDIRHFMNTAGTETVTFGLRQNRVLVGLASWTNTERVKADNIARVLLGDIVECIEENTRRSGAGGRERSRPSKTALIYTKGR